MNKSEIRKKILKIRKKNNYKKLKINFSQISEILGKEKNGKIVGGYYPYNYEIDTIDILERI